MLNKVTLIGNLGKDPVLKQVGQGIALCDFSIACTEKYKDRDGNMVEKTEWVNLTAWRGLAETCGKYLAKGSKVYVEGKLETQSWEDKQTQEKRYKTIVVADKVIFLTPKGGSNGASPAQQGGGARSGNGQGLSADDDLPF